MADDEDVPHRTSGSMACQQESPKMVAYSQAQNSLHALLGHLAPETTRRVDLVERNLPP